MQDRMELIDRTADCVGKDTVAPVYAPRLRVLGRARAVVSRSCSDLEPRKRFGRYETNATIPIVNSKLSLLSIKQ